MKLDKSKCADSDFCLIKIALVILKSTCKLDFVSDNAQKKSCIRKEIRTSLRNMTAEQVALESEDIQKKIVTYLNEKYGSNVPLNIATFSPLEKEPDLLRLHALLPQAKFYYPLCGKGNTITFHEINFPSSQMQPGMMGIKEPHSSLPSLSPDQLDVILVPAMAYDRDLRRLGKGGGYYDRLFSHPDLKAEKIGIALSCQILERVPCEDHDFPVDVIISAEVSN